MCMFLGPPTETEKANISLSNENLNSQEKHLLHQHGKELCIFQLGLVKLCAFSLKENKSLGDNGIAWERLTLHKKPASLRVSENVYTVLLSIWCLSSTQFLKLVLELAHREVKRSQCVSHFRTFRLHKSIGFILHFTYKM